ncbi:nitrilase/cyanide hydratase and apolipoprotein N-acyltransferase, partial [Metarhizium brunneum ARSEF 3297]
MPKDTKATIKVAAVQASPIFLDKCATTEKVCALIRRAGSQSAQIIGFPETFIPGYPGWVELLPLHTDQAASLFLKLFNESVEVPGPETTAIGAACKEASMYAVVGVNERRAGTTGTLFNTSLFFGPDGSILHKHQKYVPTVGERLVHAPGQTGSRASVMTEFGVLSSLICGENGNPLFQYAVGLDYPVIHVASWPGHFGEGMTVDGAINVFGPAVASSVGCFVVHAVGVVGDDAIEVYGTDEKSRRFLKEQQKQSRACVMGPGGRILAKGSEGEELVFADVCVDALVKAKYGLDYAGHYNRPEIFAHLFKKYLA